MYWTPRRNRRDWHFLTVSSRDVGLLSAEHDSSDPSRKESGVDGVLRGSLNTPKPGVPLDLFDDSTSLEKQLFQYCK